MYKYIKKVKFILIEETAPLRECAYKVTKVLILKYKIPKEFITNYYKLFFS